MFNINFHFSISYCCRLKVGVWDLGQRASRHTDLESDLGLGLELDLG